MNKLFYTRLAVNNIKKNAKTYIPYILTIIGTIMMFYNMCFLAVAKDIGSVSDSGSVRYILYLGAVVIGIFSVIFLFYTNSFLIKRRKKEIGLYNILGMEKKHIGMVLLHETLLTGISGLFAGILSGILLSKLMILLLFKIISFKAAFGFEVPIAAVLVTSALFAGIFVLNLSYNIFQVHLSKPIELLTGGNAGEKEPKTKWLLAVVGLICLSIGYYIALTTETPLAALNLFFIAVVLVIIGTYCLFTAGSIAVLKIFRKNKKYYYKLNHFISVSGMIYRMKQNAAGLSNICILSTAVIIMISSTISLYAGMEDILRTRYPRNIIVEAFGVSDEEAVKLDAVIEEQMAEANIEPKNIFSYRYMSFTADQDGSKFEIADLNSYSYDNTVSLTVITEDEYNKIENKSVSLNQDEALLCTIHGKIPGDTMDLNGFKLLIKERLVSINSGIINTNELNNSYIAVVKNNDTIERIYNKLYGNSMNGLLYNCGFDVEANGEAQISIVNSLNNSFKDNNIIGYAEGAESSRASFLAVYGGLLFLGIFLGLLFIMATVLIIYYKQIAEGYDDRGRFAIMQKVGMSLSEVKKTIKSQVLAVFFLPLVTAIVHIVFAFKVITRLLAIFNFTNIPLFAACTVITIIVFAVFYALVYTLTARTYYKIVR